MRRCTGKAAISIDILTALPNRNDCCRVTAQLNREGHACSVGLVADVMRELELAPASPGPTSGPTVPGDQPTSPDLIGRLTGDTSQQLTGRQSSGTPEGGAVTRQPAAPNGATGSIDHEAL
jgi:hypothetical protein